VGNRLLTGFLTPQCNQDYLPRQNEVLARIAGERVYASEFLRQLPGLSPGVEKFSQAGVAGAQPGLGKVAMPSTPARKKKMLQRRF